MEGMFVRSYKVEIWRSRSMEVVCGYIDVGRGRSVYDLTRSMFKSRREFWLRIIAQEWKRAWVLDGEVSEMP
jgi:hypothetical protein